MTECSPPVISPSLPASSIQHGGVILTNTDNSEKKDAVTGLLPLSSTLILQVVRVQDASQSLEQHLRSVTSRENDTKLRNTNGCTTVDDSDDDTIDNVANMHCGEMVLAMSEEA
uniref:Uncharacterized protein n=1 Tax=Lygus hesperus TaxID=30085 RepID=A0A0A9Z0D2_LYGHE